MVIFVKTASGNVFMAENNGVLVIGGGITPINPTFSVTPKNFKGDESSEAPIALVGYVFDLTLESKDM